MFKYPKIETLFERDPDTFKVKEGFYRCEEFRAVNRWILTEKIDGTNVRIHLSDDDVVTIAGRTDAATLHPTLLFAIQQWASVQSLRGIFPEGQALLFGEGYGPKIQKAGGRYRATAGFRLFDVHCGGLWLRWQDVCDIAKNLHVPTVPYLGCYTLSEAVGTARCLFLSLAAGEDGGDTSLLAEGVVARSEPLMLDRRGNRVMWKLKRKDFVETAALAEVEG